MDIEARGHAALEHAVSMCSGPCVVVEMTRQFGDVLHSTLVVRHYKRIKRNVVWAIGEQYRGVFEVTDALSADQIAYLPSLPPYPDDGRYRIAWVERARTLPGVSEAWGCGVHPFGWKRGSIVDAVLLNAGISKLAVPRRPWLKLATEDMDPMKLRDPYVALEYQSRSLHTRDVDFYERLVREIGIPVVALAAADDPLVPGAVDGRGLSFRKAKAVIQASACFVGCGSGLSVLAASNGCEQPMVEMCEPSLTANALGYRHSVCTREEDAAKIGALVRGFL